MLFLYLGIYLFPFTTYFIFEKFRLTLNIKKNLLKEVFKLTNINFWNSASWQTLIKKLVSITESHRGHIHT